MAPSAAAVAVAPLGHEPVPRLGEHLEDLLLLAVDVVVAACVVAVGVIATVKLLLLVLLLLLSCILNHLHKKLWIVVRIAGRVE